MKDALLLCIVAFCFLTEVKTQENEADVLQYLTVDQGLIHNEVTCILQDRSGFLWFGTRGGLNRYDGYELRVFKNELGNPNSLMDNVVESLYEDSRGRIWIGTHSSGVSCYDPVLDRFTHYQHDQRDTNSISSNRVLTITEGKPGEFWFGTWENGFTLFREKENLFTRFLQEDSGVQRKVQSITKTRDDEMWVGTNNGLLHYRLDGTFVARYTAPGIGFNEYTQVLEDERTGELWISAWRHGLFRFDRRTKSFTQYLPDPNDPQSISFYHTYSLLQDDRKNIWIGTWGGGLNKFDHETDAFIQLDITPPALGQKNRDYQYILDLFQDQSGIIWMATEGGGVVKMDRSKNQFGIIGGAAPGGLKNGHVVSVMEDREGGLWVGTKGGGLNYMPGGGAFEEITLLEKHLTLRYAPNRLNWVTSLFQDHRGVIWAGTEYGLHKITKKAGGGFELATIYNNDYGYDRPRLKNWVGGQVSAIYETSDSVLWVGMVQRGLNLIALKDPDGETGIRNYSKNDRPGGLQSNRVTTILEDRNNRVWIGTGGGLHLYRPETDDFEHFRQVRNDPRTLSSSIINCLWEDRRGRLWIGTPNGLNLARPEDRGGWSFSCLQESDGLPDSYINAILEDAEGNLWISTNGGISKFNPETEVFYNYDRSNGLQGNAFSPGAAFRASDGVLYFGGLYGLNYFAPADIRNKNLKDKPRVVLTSLKIFNDEVGVGEKQRGRAVLEKGIPHTGSITLNHRQNMFSLEFSALDFHAPDKNLYSYKLEGFEEEWTSPSYHRTVTYTNLEPGNYTFRVRAANNSRVWNEEGASLHIRVLPPPWATVWAYFLYALVFMALLLAYRHISLRQSRLIHNLKLSQMERAKDREMAELKTRFFTNITHELRTPLTLISGPVQQLLRDESRSAEKSREWLLMIHHNTRRLLSLVNRLLDFRKAETGHMRLEVAEGNIVRFAREVFLSFQEMAHRKEVDYRFEADADRIPLYFDRDKMEIVLCNLLTNAFKYSPPESQIVLRLQACYHPAGALPAVLAGGYCEISVEDNGRGMSADLVERIFDRFYQIAQADSAQMIGTGIGLALVKNLIELHHGFIDVNSEPGRGSTFRIRLPFGPGHFKPDQIIADFKDSEHVSHYHVQMAREEVAASLATTNGHNREKETVEALIVEDNEEIRSFVRGIFEAKYKVYEAGNGWQALDLALEKIPDIIISDIMMPEMDGLSLCTRLKKDERTSHIPIILLTARTDAVFKVEGYSSGADAYVTKPFNAEVLSAQVAALLESRQKLKKHYGKKITLEPSDIEITSLDEKFIKKAIRVVEENLQNADFTTQFLAQETAMSQSTLYRKIKALTGKSVNAFIRDVRLKRAAQLLQASQLNVSEVAYRVGFGDVKYFRKCFREQFGKTPTEYVKAQNGKRNGLSDVKKLVK